jgi:transposase-like protein
MQCPHCYSHAISNRSRLTKHGYPTFFCNFCRRTFNERTNSPFNRTQAKNETILEAVLYRLRFKLSFQDLTEIFLLKGYRFSKETFRHWEEKYAPLITSELKQSRKGKATLRWKADETLIKVGSKYYYLYRAIDSNGKLVEVKLSEVRNIEATTSFFEQAVATVGFKPTQVTSDKEVTYPKAIEKALGSGVEHRAIRYANNRLEQNHRGIKSRYRSMKGFKKPESAERFCQAYDEQRDFFNHRRWHKDGRGARWRRAVSSSG